LTIPKPILDGVAAQVKIVTKGLGADLVWPGLMRKLDKIDTSFRE
jgi:hypothetical protein